MPVSIRLLLFVTCVSAAAMAALSLSRSAAADSTPVGALPAGAVVTTTAPRGTLVAVALPAPRPASGLVWRLARNVDPKVLRQAAETEAGGSVVVVFRAVGPGRVRVVFALTRGDASAKAVAVRSYRVSVR